eukprot:GFUD01021825.1.p1 GENE.GFUD01021825.1~~GFUD01021825.1.p1  ORF type:complete len:231 (+),score=59.19 GFUD01021825.1:147-839(+)
MAEILSTYPDCQESYLTRTRSRQGMKKISRVFSNKRGLGCTGSNTVLSEVDIEWIVRNTDKDRGQVEEQFQRFLRKHPDGKISKRCFLSMMKECYPSKDSARVGRHIWRMYDVNEDGHIDFREFMAVLYVMSSGTPEENLKQIFRVFDINNDGKISVAELKKIVKDLFHLINDDNSDIDSQQLLVNSAFNEMDENCDGEVSIEEFIQACLSQKKFSTLLTLQIINILISK